VSVVLTPAAAGKPCCCYRHDMFILTPHNYYGSTRIEYEYEYGYEYVYEYVNEYQYVRIRVAVRTSTTVDGNISNVCI